MADKNKLSDRQQSILHYIWEYTRRQGRPPTIREIGEAVDISSTSVVNYNLGKLKDKGFIGRDAEVSRGLRLADKTLQLFGPLREAVENLVRVPMMGTIKAGEPIPVFTDAFDEDDSIELSASLLTGKHEDLYALRVSGDSMIDAMVNDGDIVVMRHQPNARNGEMVAVWLEDDESTTLKYFYHEGNTVRLQPANPTMGPIYVDPANVRVQGKVVMVVRQTA